MKDTKVINGQSNNHCQWWWGVMVIMLDNAIIYGEVVNHSKSIWICTSNPTELNYQCDYLAPNLWIWPLGQDATRVQDLWGVTEIWIFDQVESAPPDGSLQLWHDPNMQPNLCNFRVKELIIAVCGYDMKCLRNTWIKDDRNYKHIYVLAQTTHIHSGLNLWQWRMQNVSTSML